MKVSLVDRDPVKVAYLRHVGPYGEPLSRFWRAVAYPWMVANNLLAQPRYGVSHDDPTVTSPQRCRYDAAVLLQAPLIAPGAALTTTLAGGRYVVTEFKGASADIGEVWNRMLRDWLPASGLQLDARPFLECYRSSDTLDPDTGVFTCEIAVPVIPL